MEQYLATIQKCPLFRHIEENELESLFFCLSARIETYAKNTFVFSAGSRALLVGIVLSGGVHVVHEDFWGNRALLAGVGVAGLFGESFSCAETENLPVSVVAAQPSEILLIDYRKIITTCTSACVFHMTLVKNMLRILAEKNVQLTQKIEVLSRRSTRDKLLSYLSAQAQQAGSSAFTIPFNRQQLADYLSVDRSAMSSELSRMQSDGILHSHRSQFELLQMDADKEGVL